MNGNFQQQNMMGTHRQINNMLFPTPPGVFRGRPSPGQRFNNQNFQPQQFPQAQGGRWPVVLNKPTNPQSLPNIHFNQGQTGPNPQFNHMRHPQPSPQNLNPAFRNNPDLPRQSNNIPGSNMATAPSPGQVQTGRRRRHTDPDCERLKGDPDTYCRTYESLCHNCTLEKRLRFEGKETNMIRFKENCFEVKLT